MERTSDPRPHEGEEKHVTDAEREAQMDRAVEGATKPDAEEDDDSATARI